MKTERANYTTHTETIAVSKDGTPTYTSKPGKTDADYKAALVSAERRKVTYKAVFEKGPAPEHHRFHALFRIRPAEDSRIRRFERREQLGPVFRPSQYVNGSSQYYNDVYFGDDDANINGRSHADGNVYALMDTNYSKDVVTYTFHYIRKATDIDTGAKPQKEMPGATLQLLDETGTKVIKEWVTDENPLTFTLTEGNYILREPKRTMGYDIHPDMRVSLSHYGVLTVDGVVIMDDKVVLPEARTRLSPGRLEDGRQRGRPYRRHLQIVDKSTGEALDDWVSTDAAHQAKLAFGDYILREVEAPRGFDKIADVDFSVAATER